MLQNKIILITGASSGIGEACAKLFAAQGGRLIFAARREQRLQSLVQQLQEDYQTESYVMNLDVQDAKAVQTALVDLPIAWRAIDVLVNNAGLSLGLNKLYEDNIDDWQQMIDTNIKGLLYVSRAIIPGMLQRQAGHIINIGSISGREVYSGGTVYCATKHAVRAISQGLKMDLHGTPIRVSEVQPGMVETEFGKVRFHGNQQKADQFYQDIHLLTADDVAQSVLFCAMQPAHVNIREILLTAVDQTTSTMVHRQIR